MEAIHERLHQMDALVLRRVGHLLSLRRIHPEWLLAQDMLAGRQRAQGPLSMHGVDQWDVDRIHLAIFEDRVIRLGDPCKRMLGAELARAIRVPARNRHDPPVARSSDAWADVAIG